MTTARHRAAGPARSLRSPVGHRLPAVLSSAALVALAGLSLLVATGRSAALDDRVSELFRPGGEWGTLQWRVDVLVEGLRPVVALALLGALTVVISYRRRTWRPAASVAIAVGATVCGTVGLKALVGREDYHGEVGVFGGSFPSGHVVTLVVVGGCLALLLRDRPGPRAWTLVALVAGLMSWALLVQTAHWFTDILGGLLLGVSLLGLVVRLPFTDGRRDEPHGQSPSE